MESFTEILDKIVQAVDIHLAAIRTVLRRPGDKNNSNIIWDSNHYEDI